MLIIYNTRTKQKEVFKPINPKTVSLYTCGPTVYHYAHIGNLRTFIFEDVLRRLLHHGGYAINHVMNITDVGHLTSDADEGEDKMEKGARREGKTAWEIADFYTKAFIRDASDLNLLVPKTLAKATDHITDQISWIKKLEDKGYTYTISDGVYFDTSKFKKYGKLTGQPLQGLKEGARVEKNPEKRHPTDFALWKFSPKDSKRNMEWESPWGKGFPGWHLECSVMAQTYLGETIDIHAGGVDLIPTHHTNEIAQAEAVTEKLFVRYWMHGEFIILKDDAKMSKSDENFYTLQDLKQKGFDPLAFRFYTFQAHYRQKLSFSLEALDAAQKALQNLRGHIRMWEKPRIGCAEFEERFFKALEDDLNMPQAIAVMWEMIKSDYPTKAKHASILKFDEILGLRLKDLKPIVIPDDVKQLVVDREKARKQRSFEASDNIRDQIAKKGFDIDDSPEGPIVKLA